MSAANDRIRRELGIRLIEADREAQKRRPARQRERKPELPKDAVSRALLDGVVLQVKK